MKRPKITRRRLVVGLVVVVLAVLAIKTWGVPAIITSKLKARYGGRITYSGWWVGPSSSGLRNFTLHEGPERDSPVWAKADSVTTDLSLGGFFHGRMAPSTITLDKPAITFRLDADGKPLTRPPLKEGGSPGDVPAVKVEGGRVTIRQKGRPAMVVEPVFATMSPAESPGQAEAGERLNATVDSPIWGKWTAEGRFAEGFKTGAISLRSQSPMVADAEKTAMLPFVPDEVWKQVAPRGPVRVAIDLTTGPNPTVVTRGEFLGTTLGLPTLGLVAEKTTGTMTILDRVVTIEGAKGRALGGEIGASGTLDFAQVPPRFAIDLDLKGIDVGKTPKFWGLADAGIGGKLTGTAHLKIALTADGVDPTGTEGSGLVTEATLGGIDVKTLKLSMKAEGDEIKYEPVQAAARGNLDQPRRREEREGENKENSSGISLLVLRGLRAFAVDSRTLACQALLTTAFLPQDPAEPAKPPKPKGGFVLPKTLTTEVEFEDADLVQFVAKARKLGIPLPFAASGKLSLKAKATIPLGTLTDVRAYAFHGEAKLKGASIAGVDLGAVVARLDLADGVLDLSDLRGRLVERPAGHVGDPPPELEPAPKEGPMPPGGFRGKLRAELAPRGKITAHFEGNRLPLAELAAPALPHPTPLSGLASFRFDAQGDAANLGDPMAWTVSGDLDAVDVQYRGTTLERLASDFSLKGGRLAVPSLAATLQGRPLKASLAFDASPPYRFEGELDVEAWDLDALLALVPTLPRPSPVGGLLTVRVTGKGTLLPRDLSIDGEGIVRKLRAGTVALGDVPIRWQTEPTQIRVAIDDARPLGGDLKAEALIPRVGDGPIRGSATIRDLDIGTASAAIPGDALAITGRVNGKGSFLFRPQPKPGESLVEGDLTLTAPDLTVQGVPAHAFQAVFRASENRLTYDAYAEGLDGKVAFKGDAPLTGEQPEANASLQAVGFRLEGLWGPLKMGGALADLRGLAAIDANLRTHIDKFDLRARGLAEVRELRWGPNYPIGVVKGVVTITPGGWQLADLSGSIFDGEAKGSAESEVPVEGPRRLRFDLEVDRASLRKTLAFLPTIADEVEGKGTLRMAGRMAEALRVDGEFSVPDAKIMGLPLHELRAPGELEFAPGGDHGTLRVRGWKARFAGGRISGDARFGVGRERAFALDAQLSAIDLETLFRTLSDTKKPAAGKVSGKIALNGPDPSRTDQLRGRIDLDLSDASLLELPIFRELDRFLGSAQGGVFEDGELHAVIANRQIVVETLALEGRLLQMHAAGTVGFDGRLDLVVLVNTNQIIKETGQALATIAGLADAAGRRTGKDGQFANFLGNRLLKFQVSGTLASPSVELDPAKAVGGAAVGFFAGVLKLPSGLIR